MEETGEKSSLKSKREEGFNIVMQLTRVSRFPAHRAGNNRNSAECLQAPHCKSAPSDLDTDCKDDLSKMLFSGYFLEMASSFLMTILLLSTTPSYAFSSVADVWQSSDNTDCFIFSFHDFQTTWLILYRGM